MDDAKITFGTYNFDGDEVNVWILRESTQWGL
jgi:hypothetical protein